MQKKTRPVLLLALLIFISFGIAILPSFFTQGLARIQLDQTLELEHVLEGNKEIELVFFGYAGCRDVCTPRLEVLAKWYSTLAPSITDKTGVRFLDLSQPEDRTLPESFAKAFHPKFEGVYLDEKSLRLYTRAFSVYFSRSLMDENEMDHTAHLYLIKKDKKGKKLRFIYTAYPYDLQQIGSDIKELINE